MKKNPIHFYWGRKNGLVVTREDAKATTPRSFSSAISSRWIS